MNEQDYKAIAEIIRKRIENVKNSFILMKSTKKIISVDLMGLAQDLMDYFEKKGKYIVSNGVDSYEDNDFKREQFLKDCGVEK